MSRTAGSPIIVGIDGSASAKAALDWAVGTARRRNAPLRLVNATALNIYASRWQDPTPPAQTTEEVAWSLLSTALAALEDVDVVVEPHVGTGSPAAVLLEQAADAQMVVVGSRGHGDLIGLLLGSTSLQVAMHAPCPVVVVREPASGQELGRSAGRVVVGVDGTEVSEAAVRFAFEEADARGAGLTALHAWTWPESTLDAAQPPVWDGVEGEEDRALLSERLAGWSEKFPDVHVIQRSFQAQPASAIVAESAGAALTVIGSRGSGGFKGLLLGSVSHTVLHHAGSPVAVVRTGEDQR